MNEGVKGPCPRNSSCEHTHVYVAYTYSYGVCSTDKCLNTYVHPHTLQIYWCSCRHMYAHTEEEYEMSVCNYMVNVVMIWCLNISTVLCRAGTPAIHSQGQARRQQHEPHENECVHPTRELAVQRVIFMTSSLLKASRRQGRENLWKIRHKSGGERDGWSKRDSKMVLLKFLLRSRFSFWFQAKMNKKIILWTQFC